MAAGWIRLCSSPETQDRCEAVRLRGIHSGGHSGIFPAALELCGAAVCATAGRDSTGLQRPESAAAVSRNGDSPADALPGLCGLLSPVRICAGGADDALS